jgi:CDGSH-type Zn-finger protein
VNPSAPRESLSGVAPELRIYPNGPILVRGNVTITDQDGAPVQRRRRVIALCRCGHSGIAPLCDGTHKVVPGFGKPTRAAKITNQLDEAS